MAAQRSAKAPARLVLYLVAALVLVPATVMTAVLGCMAIVFAVLGSGTGLASRLVWTLAVTGAGVAAIVSMWVLFFHFRRTRGNPRRPLLHCMALAGGVAVSCLLLRTVHGPLPYPLAVFGSPMAGAAYFLWMLFANRGTRG